MDKNINMSARGGSTYGGKKIIIANWKMNPSSLKETKKIFDTIRKAASRLKNVETVICPPFVYLNSLNPRTTLGLSKGSPWIGAQDLFWQESGSYTGEISAKMLKNLGVQYVIIGHSERREYLKETNEMINKKIKTALKNNLKVIFCIGEKKRDSKGKYLSFIEEEILKGLKGIQKKLLNNLIIAYEPIWAIGKKTKQSDTPKDVFQMSMYIRKIAGKIPILYGGSVSPENAENFLCDTGIHGLLVGHKSLIPKDFNKILKIADKSR